MTLKHFYARSVPHDNGWVKLVVKPTKVLLIEDNAGDALLTGLIVAALPFPIKLVIARNGEQALTILTEPEFDAALIILDLDIPKVHGHVVLERNPRRDIPVVILSGSSNLDDMRRARELGACDYFVKPIDLHAYQDAVLGMIEKWAVPNDGAANGACATS
jgi:DNA-binding NtrC family response regulator